MLIGPELTLALVGCPLDYCGFGGLVPNRWCGRPRLNGLLNRELDQRSACETIESARYNYAKFGYAKCSCCWAQQQ